MVHFITVHFKEPHWIKTQTDFIRKFAGADCKIHTVLTDISDEYKKYFDHVYDSNSRSHAENLNFMASEVISQYKEKTDVLVFIDGDAFPIAPIQKYVDAINDGEKLIGIQRLENNGDLQPHPCFTMTNIAFWLAINGDWSPGFKWLDSQGDRVTDVGGLMLGKLNEKNISWVKLHRTNRRELHELFFGIYDDTIYHHGAGFRRVFGGRITAVKAGIKDLRKTLIVRGFKRYVPDEIENWLFDRNIHPLSRFYVKLEKECKPISTQVFKEIMADQNYVYSFLEEGPSLPTKLR